ncbi:methionyl-tRNA formyltransferase [Patescibacteria group bacterium]|nr:methionyl-tRNA formyltransferase [Patescibacteria group bacterium]
MVENTHKYRVVFMGTPEFAVPALQTLINNPAINIEAVITRPDKPSGRTGTPQPSPIKQLAIQNNLDVITPEKIKNNAEFIAQLKSINPNVIVVVAYGKILPQEILDIPKHGVVNVHASLLPQYRGASPITASILNGDEYTGVTLMKMELAMDTGPIIIKSDLIKIEDSDTIASLTQKLMQVGVDLLDQHLIKYLSGEIKLIPQDDAQATYVKIINKTDGKIDWQHSADMIDRQIRAYNPWPSAYTTWQNQNLKILQGQIISSPIKPTGQIWLTEDKFPAVATPQNSVKLLNIQLAGKKPTSGRDFLQGHPNFIGTILN